MLLSHRRRGSPPRPIYGWRNRIASAVKTRARHSGELLRRRERRPGLAAELPARRACKAPRYKAEWSSKQPSTHYSMPMTMAMEEMLESVAAEGYAGIIVVSGCGVMEEIAYLVNLLWKRSEPVIFANLMVQGRAGVKEGLMNLHRAVVLRRALAGRAEQRRAHLLERRALRRGRRRPRRPRVSRQRVPVSEGMARSARCSTAS